MYYLICYAVHEKCVAEVKEFMFEENARTYMHKDIEKAFRSIKEIVRSKDNIRIEIDKTSGYLINDEAENYYEFTWEIIEKKFPTY